MADIADLAQKLAFYQNGGKDPGQSEGERFNQGFSNVAAMGGNILGIVRASLAAKQAQLEQAPAYKIDPSAPQNQDEIANQQKTSDLAQANYNKAFQAQRDSAGISPDPGQRPTPFANPNIEYQKRTGRFPLATLGQNKELASIDALRTGTENRAAGTNLVRQKIDLGQIVYMSGKDGSVSDIQDPEHNIPLQRGQVGAQSTKIAMQTNKSAEQDASIDPAAKSVISGNAALSQFPGFGANSMKGKVIRRVLELQPDFDFRKNEANFSALKTYANYINSGPYQNTIKYLESVGPNLNQVLDLSSKISRTQFPLINRGVLETMRQTGDPDVVAYAAAVTEVGDQIAKILQGGGTGSPTSDAKIKQASELLNGSYTPEQLSAVAGTLGSMLENRRAALENETVKQVGGQKSATPRPAGPQIKQKSNDPLGIR